MIDQLAPYAKAFAAGLAGALVVLVPVIDDGLTPSECLWAAVAFLANLGITYAVPNKPKPSPSP